MKLDISEIYHQYVIKIVIFALFTFKRQIRQPNIYKQSIHGFVNKRLQWKINLKIDTGVKLDRDDERDLIIDQIVNDVDSDYMSVVTITFTTPKREVTMEIDMKDEEKYEKFLYS